ncbi:HORMA domain-containing protein 1 isoform X2 [Synchiropus splendidus]|uniref:HORMA domain-containing protein 1 isoform X2 n=1 Tax=Synchiropus splendidus TaxID=270530 RepID=UPI00237E8A2F|nr:HORMA domain-containing protein 1 isoform X2 [Synchiropus splendidus]
MMATCPLDVKRSQFLPRLLPNQLVTEQQSLQLVKKLLTIAVSSVTYLRGLLPEKAYTGKSVGDTRVMILAENACPAATQIIHWLKGCFEAIEKKYLQAATLTISSGLERPEIVTELYRFRIQYTSAGAQMDFQCNDNMTTMECGNATMASSTLVLKLFMLLQDLGPLPGCVRMRMMLSYYHEVTPQQYHPPGFKAADGSALEFEKEPVKLRFGGVDTRFHTIKLDMTTERHRLEQVEPSVCVKESWLFEGEARRKSHAMETETSTDTDTTLADFGSPEAGDKSEGESRCTKRRRLNQATEFF